MSGPKGFQLGLASRELERLQNRNRCSAFLSAYARLEQEHDELRKRVTEVGLTASSRLRRAADLESAVKQLIEQGRDGDAVRGAEAAVNSAREAVETAKSRLQERVIELQRRFRQLRLDCAALSSERETLVRCVRAGVPANWPQQQREALLRLVGEVLIEVVVPHPVQPELQLDTIRRLEQAEAMIVNSRRLLQRGRQRVEAEVNRVHAELLTARLGANLKPPKRLEDVLKENSGAALSAAADPEVLAKLDRVLAEASILHGTGGWGTLLAKAETIRQEKDSTRRRMLYEALLLECGALLKTLREVERWQSEIDKLIDGAAHLKGTAVDGLVVELEALRRAGRVTDLSRLSARLKSVIAAEEKRLEREQKRRAVLESLAELGYEVEEGAMATALVAGGKLVVRKPAEDEYAVEVVANSECSAVQTRVIRYAAAEDPTEQQRQRDKEREETWCADHARMLERMAQRGLESKFILRIPAGQHPVKVVLDDERVRARRRAGSPEARKVQREKK